jgi:glutamate formiminotransferase
LAVPSLIAPNIIECVPNFSEGRDERITASLAASIVGTPGVRLLDRSADADHNRSVFTLTGAPDAVVDAALAAAEVAVELIDLNRHTGVHPRIGAVDVVPFVPLFGAGMQECAGLARIFGEKLWDRLRVPVFLYERAAVRPEYRNLEQVRRLARGGAPPDIGAGRHPTAGACAVGARDFLIAWNIWLDTSDLGLAKRIAQAVRFSSGGLPGVKALGLPLETMGIVQVSINTTDFRATPLHVVFEAVRAMAERAGVRVRGSELIGMIPKAVLDLSATYDLHWLNLSPARVLGEE